MMKNTQPSDLFLCDGTSNMRNLSHPDTEHYRNAFLVVQFTQASSITVLNLLIITVYRMMHYNRKTVSNYLLFIQGISDLYIGFIIWCEILLHYLETHGYFTPGLMMVYQGMLEYSYTLSLGNLFICAVERYLSINKPIFHRRNVTKLRVICGSLLVCLVSLIPTTFLLVLTDFSSCNEKSFAVVAYSFVFDIVMISLITSSVIILAKTLNNARDVIKPKKPTTALLRAAGENMALRKTLLEAKEKKEFRLVKIFTCMIVAYLFSYLPVTTGRILFDVGLLNSLDPLETIVLISLCHTLYKVSALFNPLLTMTLREDYRTILAKWTVRHYSKKKKKKKSSEELFKLSVNHSVNQTACTREYVYTTYV